MPCCHREEGTTRFCRECIHAICQRGRARCPQCRQVIVLQNDEVAMYDPHPPVEVAMYDPHVLTYHAAQLHGFIRVFALLPGHVESQFAWSSSNMSDAVHHVLMRERRRAAEDDVESA